ncbi:ATP-dependent DNA helicase RecG [Telmatospirillum siberiense]|uniref:ATP-dependent DNA helicase RecG n=1 Tax=Telmatospirillum siberiense TaxID=382514 RepID=A0A2N3PS76_9PROT|nr:ATP-dependent DNA helicase RecG [Telmatospirillum siberiense]PKU23250.1 ATP-dependent DNA helicase RecG [Telmatospirillum siberiense]
MRPENLYPLFAPITALAGVGPRLAPLVEKVAGPHVVDLLWHLPYALIDRRFTPKIADAPAGRIATIEVMVDLHIPSDSARRPYRVRCSDETGEITLVFFHAKRDWLEKLLPVGETRIVSGMIEAFNEGLQITHPDHVVPSDRRAEVMTIEPVYPLTAGLPGKVMVKAVRGAVERTQDLAEWLDPAYLRRQAWPTWREALRQAHAPDGEASLSPMTPARQRLAYDELLSNQLALALVRASLRKLAGRPIVGDGGLRQRIISSLPFSLTGAQSRALAEIDADMALPARMLRLLQGDVGSGKTVVALLAMAAAVETGAQAALMAPTEILARQHLATLEKPAAAAGLRLALLTGRDKGKTRQKILDALAAGQIDILIGTHALFQEEVVFRDLALAVIDEQHRFGVHQRLDLAAKGHAVDMLVMTATPIPRTLMLTAYGDMDVSRLDEKPPGRRPIDTRVLPLARLDQVTEGVGRAIKAGAKVYWICPLVDDSEKLDLAAVTARHGELRELLGPRVGLVHGRMKGPEKDAAMAAFAGDGLDLLVATTVIEVGVNVPEATVMVIEHAERFGLAQLHQLRGRIGRGDKDSTCLLLYGAPLSENAKSRLNILRDSEDGFRIAEEDLKLRGAGELLGTRQSGLPEFRMADLAQHGDLLATARDDARLILETDPELQGARGKALRTLLYLFERDAVVKTLRSG